MTDFEVKDLDLAGVKWEITDVPMVIRAKWEKNQAATTPAPETARGSVVPPIAPVEALSLETVTSIAARPNDIDNLVRVISEFNHPLRAATNRAVLPNIATNPNGLVIVTDVPGTDDDATGQILSGAAGELLDKMLAAIGMGRDTVSIVPIIFWRTPGGRTPTDTELSLARPFVNKLLEFLHPSMILTLGATPAQEIAGIKLANAHGTVSQTTDGTTVMSIYHPNYLLLKPSAKRDAWTALQELQNLLKN